MNSPLVSHVAAGTRVPSHYLLSPTVCRSNKTKLELGTPVWDLGIPSGTIAVIPDAFLPGTLKLPSQKHFQGRCPHSVEVVLGWSSPLDSHTTNKTLYQKKK